MATIPEPYRLPSFLRESMADYHSHRGAYLSSHQLADFRRSPLLYRSKLLGLIKDEDRPAFVLGRAVHSLTLEGMDAFLNEFTQRKTLDSGTRTTLQKWQWDFTLKMAAAVHRHPLASQLLEDGQAEGVLRGLYCGLKCQVRLDWFSCLHGIVDLKTCESLDEFTISADRYDYPYQMAFYRSLTEIASEQSPRVWIIAVEKQGTHRVGVWRVRSRRLEACRKENEAAIQRLSQCLSTQTWPQSADYEEVQEL